LFTLQRQALSFPRKELNMTDDRELAKKCAFDARTLLNDMQGNGHIDELRLLKAMQLLVDAVQALASERIRKSFFAARPPR
jgi:hypothetical protein